MGQANCCSSEENKNMELDFNDKKPVAKQSKDVITRDSDLSQAQGPRDASLIGGGVIETISEEGELDATQKEGTPFDEPTEVS